MNMMLLARPAEIPPGSDRAPPPQRPHLTATEFLQLGLFRVAYLKPAKDGDGTSGVIIHGADGAAVAVADTVEDAEEMTAQAGLVLVAVH